MPRMRFPTNQVQQVGINAARGTVSDDRSEAALQFMLQAVEEVEPWYARSAGIVGGGVGLRRI